MVTSFKIGQGFAQEFEAVRCISFPTSFFLWNNNLSFCTIVWFQFALRLVMSWWPAAIFRVSADEYQQHWWWGGCLGWAVLVQEPCLLWKLSTLLKLKRGKKKKGERVEIYFYFVFFKNIIWCLFLIASRACKNIYLSFIWKSFF